MKKIMKKVLSLAIVLALAIAPMTVMAATGTESDPIEVEANDTVTTDGTGVSKYYVYNASVTADYEIVVTGAVDSFGYSMIHPMTGMPMENYAYNGELIMYAYGTKEVTFSMFDHESQELTIAITAIEGTEQDDNIGSADGSTAGSAIALTESPSHITVPGSSMLYYKATVDADASYTLSLYNRTGASFDLYLYNPRLQDYGYYNSSDNGVLDAIVSTDSTEYVFAVANTSGLELALQVTLTKEGGDDNDNAGGGSEDIVGTTDSPDTLLLDTDMTTTLTGQGTYWYSWGAAEQDGKITVTPGECTAGWTASVFKGADLSEYVGYYSSEDASSFDVIVSTGDVVLVGINNPDWEAGTVELRAIFTEGTFEQDNDDNDDDGSIEGDNEVNYTEDSTPLVVGDNALTVSNMYIYTVYYFEPAETGVYTLTSNDSEMGIVGYFWVNENPTADVVKENTIEWECTSVGQGIYVAVMAYTNVANINIAKENLAPTEEVEWTVYDNKATLESFTFEGDGDKLTFVDIEDEVEDKAVLGDDGYYHLNTEDGPILYVDLDDTYGTINVIDAMGYGQLKHIVTENGETVAKIDYNTAFGEYVAVADANTMLYPLTEDLMTIYKSVGESQLWYGENGWVGGTKDDAWMFACYYAEGTTGGNTTTGSISGSTTNTDSPKTGDNASVAVWAIVMVVAAGAAFVVAETKKRAR